MMTAQAETGCHALADQAPETWSVERLLAEAFLIDDSQERLRDQLVPDIEDAAALDSC